MTRHEYEEHFNLDKKNNESDFMERFAFIVSGALAGFFTDYLIFAVLVKMNVLTNDVLFRSLPFGITVGALFALALIDWSEEKNVS